MYRIAMLVLVLTIAVTVCTDARKMFALKAGATAWSPSYATHGRIDFFEQRPPGVDISSPQEAYLLNLIANTDRGLNASATEKEVNIVRSSS
jgi:hypothetical protein